MSSVMLLNIIVPYFSYTIIYYPHTQLLQFFTDYITVQSQQKSRGKKKRIQLQHIRNVLINFTYFKFTHNSKTKQDIWHGPTASVVHFNF
jgi:hypothetical protein